MVEEFVALLEAAGCNPRPTGHGQWSSCCPCHDDRNPSMSVGTADDGRALANCFASCTQQEIRAWRDAQPRTKGSHAAPSPRGRRKAIAPAPGAACDEALVARWIANLHENSRAKADYFGPRLLARRWRWATLRECEVGFDGYRWTLPQRDEHGVLTGAVRYSDRPGRAAKTLAVNHTRRQLWPFFKLGPRCTPWICEGEADALMLLSAGIPGVGIPGVAGWKSAWAQRFAGHDVVICMDADDPGRTAAQRIAADLHDVASSVGVVDLAPGRDDGFDVTDLAREVAAEHGGHAVREAFLDLVEGSR